MLLLLVRPLKHNLTVVSDASGENSKIKFSSASCESQHIDSSTLPLPWNKGDVCGTNWLLIRKWEDTRRIKKSAIIWTHKLLAG